jgi:tetratricopeptide (TPR) repeat protein
VPRNTDNHLSREEIAQLVEETEAAPRSPMLESSRELVDHAAACVSCGLQVRSQCAVQTNLNALVSFVASERTSDCPAEGKWLPLSAGVLSEQEAAPLLEHASTCDYCARLLRETAAALEPEQSDQTRDVVKRLASSNPEWQRKLAHRLSDLSQPTADGSHVRTPSTSWRIRMQLMGRWARWALAGTVAVLLTLSIGLWINNSRSSLSSTNQLIAQAYTEQRPLVLRFPGARYGPLRQQRGEQSSKMDQPPELLEADLRVARSLARNPKDPGWLQAKASIDLLEGNYQSAIDTLQETRASRLDDFLLKLDLAMAFFERGQAKDQPDDYEKAAQLLALVLKDRPNDEVSIFNYAVTLERLGRYQDAIAAWKHYLQIDRSGEWSEEAQQRLGQMTRKANHE